MKRSVKIALAAIAALVVLGWAGSVWFNELDARRSAATGFAQFGGEAGLRDISMRAERAKTLSGSGKGVVIPGKDSSRIGRTHWTVSADGKVEGRAPERGLTVVWTPELKDGTVEWRCSAEPKAEFLRGVCDHTRGF